MVDLVFADYSMTQIFSWSTIWVNHTPKDNKSANNSLTDGKTNGNVNYTHINVLK